MDYREAGVDIGAGEAWVGVVRRLVASRPANPAAGGIGGFSGLYKIGGGRSIAACCDGVGTKLALGAATGIYRGLGQDLVAMSVNDLATCGATPLFFLDYIACERLDARIMEEIMEGILDACQEGGCALLGGETAELPGIYPSRGFDLAGFAVGIVDDATVIDGSGIAEGDAIVGLPSSGVHSNGYSLVREALVDGGLRLSLGSRPDELGGEALGEALMRPTRIYVRAASAARAAAPVRGMAHITGGGLESNINRVIPGGLVSKIDYSAWGRPGVFGLIARAGVDEAEMRRVFNLGVGYVFIVPPEAVRPLTDALAAEGESPVEIGRVARA
jgi:phosphoribosylformylglycinamidine cyclo-ligase